MSELIQEAKIKICKSGLHVFDGRRCIACEKIRKVAYRASHREKISAYYESYCEVNQEKIKARQAAYRISNADKLKVKGAAYRANNADKVRLASAAWAAKNPERMKKNSANWYVANQDRVKKMAAAWEFANPDSRRTYKRNRRARMLLSNGKLSKGLADKLFKLQKGKCACCKKPLGNDYHLDHIMPLAKGGSNTDDNMQLLTATCNRQKNTKDPIDFMQSRGFLL